MPFDPIVISAYARAPIGGFLGRLSSLSAPDLGAHAIQAAVQRSGIASDQISAVTMGCILPAGVGQAPARQAVIRAGLPLSVQAATVNKMCGSGMQAAIFAHDALAARAAEI